MGKDLIVRHFQRMGARVSVESGPGVARRGSSAMIDVRRDSIGEFFEIVYDVAENDVEVVNVRPSDRHLLLLVRHRNGTKDKFVCGHDERSWFVAAVPDLPGVSDVRTALEALKPEAVQRLQHRAKLAFDKRQTRRNPVWVRQGEWFFIPAPNMTPKPHLILANEPLRRGGGKPHMVESLYRELGESVMVCKRYPNGIPVSRMQELLRRRPDLQRENWTPMMRNPIVYAKGRIRHSDHQTIVLPGWHRVLMNTENLSRAMQHVAFLD